MAALITLPDIENKNFIARSFFDWKCVICKFCDVNELVFA